jgi:hypothetical protein
VPGAPEIAACFELNVAQSVEVKHPATDDVAIKHEIVFDVRDNGAEKVSGTS